MFTCCKNIIAFSVITTQCKNNSLLKTTMCSNIPVLLKRNQSGNLLISVKNAAGSNSVWRLKCSELVKILKANH